MWRMSAARAFFRRDENKRSTRSVRWPLHVCRRFVQNAVGHGVPCANMCSLQVSLLGLPASALGGLVALGIVLRILVLALAFVHLLAFALALVPRGRRACSFFPGPRQRDKRFFWLRRCDGFHYHHGRGIPLFWNLLRGNSLGHGSCQLEFSFDHIPDVAVQLLLRIRSIQPLQRFELVLRFVLCTFCSARSSLLMPSNKPLYSDSMRSDRTQSAVSIRTEKSSRAVLMSRSAFAFVNCAKDATPRSVDCYSSSASTSVLLTNIACWRCRFCETNLPELPTRIVTIKTQSRSLHWESVESSSTTSAADLKGRIPAFYLVPVVSCAKALQVGFAFVHFGIALQQLLHRGLKPLVLAMIDLYSSEVSLSCGATPLPALSAPWSPTGVVGRAMCPAIEATARAAA